MSAIELLAGLERVGHGEQTIGMLGGELATILGLAGGEQHRIALRHARDVERPLDLEVLALVVQRAHARRIEELAGRLVLHEGIVGPAVPQALADLDELVGALVALVLGDMLGAAEVERVVRIGRRHDVPAGAALAQVIERGVAARQRIGLVVGRGRRRQEADVLRELRHRRHHQDRIEHRRAVGGTVGGEQRRLVHLAHRVAVGQEQEVEQAALGRLRRLDRVIEVHDVVGPGVLVTPAAEMAAQTQQPSHQVHHDATPRSLENAAVSGSSRAHSTAPMAAVTKQNAGQPF